ncbi:MAG: hypothetical protein K6D98_03990 [Clostridiales bacterium]|nr:hypothetical protein [Clostridia bacterium]MCR5353445.1 hypothetical protein [Clostridiales bacterium]
MRLIFSTASAGSSAFMPENETVIRLFSSASEISADMPENGSGEVTSILILSFLTTFAVPETLPFSLSKKNSTCEA